MIKKMSEFSEKDIEIRNEIIRDMYIDALEISDCCDSWFIRRYALRLKDIGIDVSDYGTYEILEDLKLYKTLKKQWEDRDFDPTKTVAKTYEKVIEELEHIVEIFGLEVEDET